MKKIILLLSLFSLGNTLFAVTHFKDPYPSKFKRDPSTDAPVNIPTATDWERMENEAKSLSSRKPSNINAEVSNELSEIVKKFVGENDPKTNIQIKKGITTVDELEKIIDKAEDANYLATLPLDARFTMAQLPMLRAYRGFLYRIRPYAETSKISQSSLLTIVRSLVSWSHLYFPTDQWNLISDYITQPQNGMPEVYEEPNKLSISYNKYGKPPEELESARIHTSDELLHFIAFEIKPRLVYALNQISEIEKRMNEDTTFNIDNRILYGTGAFLDNLDRYRRIGKPEIWSLLSGSYSALSQMHVTFSYSMTNIMKVFEELGKLQGVDVLMNWDAQGSPSRDRRNKIVGIKNLFQFNATNGKIDMEKALSYLRTAVNYGSKAETALSKRSSSEIYAIDSAFVSTNHRRLQLGYDQLKRMLNGRTTIRSEITGKVLDIDLTQFFLNPPSNLKNLLPIQFVSGNKTLIKTIKNSNGKMVQVSYRNYREGEASGWNYQEYKKYFPSIKSQQQNKNGEEIANIKDEALILAQAYGGFMPLGTLGMFLF